jgi:hypothetical protein
VRVTERGTSGGALGAPARLLTHSWRDLIAIGLHEARLPPDSVESD